MVALLRHRTRWRCGPGGGLPGLLGPGAVCLERRFGGRAPDRGWLWPGVQAAAAKNKPVAAGVFIFHLTPWGQDFGRCPRHGTPCGYTPRLAHVLSDWPRKPVRNAQRLAGWALRAPDFGGQKNARQARSGPAFARAAALLGLCAQLDSPSEGRLHVAARSRRDDAVTALARQQEASARLATGGRKTEPGGLGHRLLTRVAARGFDVRNVRNIENSP